MSAGAERFIADSDFLTAPPFLGAFFRGAVFDFGKSDSCLVPVKTYHRCSQYSCIVRPDFLCVRSRPLSCKRSSANDTQSPNVRCYRTGQLFGRRLMQNSVAK